MIVCIYKPRDLSSMKVNKGNDQMGPCRNPIKESNTHAVSSLSFILPLNYIIRKISKLLHLRYTSRVCLYT